MKTSHKFVRKLRGFTLIELLIVIAIIAILTGIITSSLVPAKSRARDAKRISDLGQLQLALGLYFDRCKEYPNSLATTASNGCPSGVTLASYISTIPKPPTGPLAQSNYGYNYYTLNTKVADYVLSIKLENPNEALKDGLPAGSGAGGSGAWSGASTCDNVDDSNDPADLVDYCLGPK